MPLRFVKRSFKFYAENKGESVCSPSFDIYRAINKTQKNKRKQQDIHTKNALRENITIYPDLNSDPLSLV